MGNDKIINEGSQPEVEKLHRILRNLLIIIISILVTLSLIIFILFIVPVLQETTSGHKTEITNNQELKRDASYKKKISLMTSDIQRLSRKYSAYTSGQSYIVINTTGNRFSLYKNKKLIREGFCSTGKLTMLKTERGDKVWVFKTPKGKHWIHGKITNPSWTRPDWSFIEEGLPVPAKDDPSRYESGVLGDYAMSMGDGYLIHGTIYKRFLGMPVTHGCVRLNDEDLEVVYNTLSIGSKVYIF
ncbi:MAG: L,D-transpeptidase [Bacteroidia bacterium]|nr:L,D-transpeptidase [Bacteroidia bacterium]